MVDAVGTRQHSIVVIKLHGAGPGAEAGVEGAEVAGRIDVAVDGLEVVPVVAVGTAHNARHKAVGKMAVKQFHWWGTGNSQGCGNACSHLQLLTRQRRWRYCR